jgi:succinate-acetate transporter protein
VGVRFGYAALSRSLFLLCVPPHADPLVFSFSAGNTFGATAFSAYGGFWLSFGLIYWPSSGILTAEYAVGELESALGIYLITWSVFENPLFDPSSVATLTRLSFFVSTGSFSPS